MEIARKHRPNRPAYADIDELELTRAGKMLAEELESYYRDSGLSHPAHFTAEFAVKWMTTLEAWAFKAGVVRLPAVKE